MLHRTAPRFTRLTRQWRVQCFSSNEAGTPATTADNSNNSKVADMGGRKKAPVDHNAPLQKFKAYLELSKFRLSSLVVVTTGAGFICAGQMPIDFPTMAAACVGTFLCAGSASAYNQIIERDIDAKMKRTLMRPLPSGRLGATEGTVLATGMGVAGTAMLYAINPVVAALGFGNILLYAGLYTHTKRTTELNTWIGSLVGAIPPVMGWAAATGGSVLAVEPLALGGLLFLWQFPHFFALSYLHREDYSRGNFQMVACNDPTGMRSADLIMRYSVYLAALPVATTALGLTSYMFLLEGSAANAYLLYLAQKFRSDRTNAGAKRVFMCSLWYLPVLLAGFVFHSRMWEETSQRSKLGLGPRDEFAEAVVYMREKMRGVCVHEQLEVPHICPKVQVSKEVSKAQQEIENASVTTATGAGAIGGVAEDGVAAAVGAAAGAGQESS